MLVGDSLQEVKFARSFVTSARDRVLDNLSNNPNDKFNRSNGRLPPAFGLKSYSTISGWDNVLYPESELEVGGPAPDFSLEGACVIL